MFVSLWSIYDFNVCYRSILLTYLLSETHKARMSPQVDLINTVQVESRWPLGSRRNTSMANGTHFTTVRTEWIKLHHNHAEFSHRGSMMCCNAQNVNAGVTFMEMSSRESFFSINNTAVCVLWQEVSTQQLVFLHILKTGPKISF